MACFYTYCVFTLRKHRDACVCHNRLFFFIICKGRLEGSSLRHSVPSRHGHEHCQRLHLALALLLKLAPGGVLVMAPVCSSWVFLRRLQTANMLC